MLRSPGWPGTFSKRPSGSSGRRRSASARSCGDPAGRRPTATWRRISAIARSASKRLVRAAGTGGRGPRPAASEAAPPPLPPISGKPLTASTTRPAPSASWTINATTRTRTDSPPERSVVGRHRLEDVGEAPARVLPARRDVLGRHAVGRRLVAAQDLPRNGLAVDLVRAVVEARGARVAVHGLEREVGRVAERSVDLQRPVDDVVHDARAEELDERDVLPRGRRALRVHLPRGVQRHQARRLHLRRRIGDPVLDRLLLGERAAARLAVQRALAEHVERAPRDAEPAHAVVDAPRPEALLGDEESGALVAEQVLRRHAHVLVQDLGVVAELAERVVHRVLHRPDVADDVHARRVGRDDDHGRALVRPRVGVGDRHDDEEVGDRPVRREPLVAVYHPLVALAHGARAQRRRVRPGHARLGHRERRLEVAGEQRLEPALLLVGRAGDREDLAVAGVGRGVAERVRRERRRAEDLVHQPELDLPEALAAQVRRQVRGPQTPALDLLLQRLVEPVELLLGDVVDDRLERPDLRAHEVAHPVELLLELGLRREIPRHRAIRLSVGVRAAHYAGRPPGMRVVVIGATGNVGTALLRALREEDAVDEIVGVARRRPDGPPPPKTTWAQADISRDTLEPLLDGADCVVHLAWLIQRARDEPVPHATNVEGSAPVFSAAAAAGVPAVVYASSIGTYAPGPKDHGVDEAWPTTGVPSSFYSRHKAATERELDRFESEHPGIRVVRLRPGLIFQRAAATGIRRLFVGPLLPSPLVRPGLVPVVPRHPRLRAPALHSDDVADAYRRAVVNPDARGAYNVAAEPPLDGDVVARLLGARAVDVPARVLRGGAALSWWLRLQPSEPGWVDMGLAVPLMDCTRARDQLGWSARRSAEHAFLELLAGLRDGAGHPTPPLDPSTSGPMRVREVLTGVGRTSK